MSFLDAIKSGYKKTFVFTGRAGRTEFWYFVLFDVILQAIRLAFLFYGPLDDPWSTIVYVITLFIIYLPLVSLLFRRMHDTGRSGFLAVLYGIITFLYIPVMIILNIYMDNTAIDDLDIDEGKEFFGIIFRTLIGYAISWAVILILVIIFASLRSQKGPNKYGDMPEA